MAGKWTTAELVVGNVYDTTFYVNPVDGSPYRYRATHLDGRRAPKVILSDDERIRPGSRTRVRLEKVHKPERADRGWLQVEVLDVLELEIEGIYLDPIVSKKLQVLLESGLNILLDGPQGSGKTVLAKALAETLGMEFVFFNCAAVLEATDFLATIQVRASDSGSPITDFVSTDLRKALLEAGESRKKRYLVFLDELNRCPEPARNALMPALDSVRKVFDPVTNSFLSIPDNVQFVAAVNRGRAFSATFGIDAAQLDRFAPLQVTYLPAEEEVKLLRRRHPEVTRSRVELVVQIANVVRDNPEVVSGLSVRATEEACIYLAHPLLESADDDMFAEILKSSFCGRHPGSWNEPDTDAGIVWRLILDAMDAWRKVKGRR